MAPSKFREALGAAMDRTTIGIARASSADEVAADLEAAIVRATAHGEGLPAEEIHVQEILTLTRYSRARVSACVASVSRRLARTRAWPVALKALALVHRLLAEGDPAYEQEVFLATTRRGRRALDMSRFGVRERARSSAWHFAAFVRAYAGYLDDRLKLRMQGDGVASPRKWRLDGGHETDETCSYTAAEEWEPVPGDKPAAEAETSDLVARAQQLKHLLDRFIECRPMGKARTNRVVAAALCRLVKESAAMYREVTEVMAALVDRFAELDTPGCIRVHAVFTSLAKTIDELDDFYYWCASAVCRPSEIPVVERVKQKKLHLMDEFIRDRYSSASHGSHSHPAPLSPGRPGVENYDDVVEATEPAPKEQQSAARDKNDAMKAAPVQPASSLAVVDDNMADFLKLDEDAPPPPYDKEHEQNLALALFGGGHSEKQAPTWVAFDHPLATVLDGMYSDAVANANAHGFAGSASSAATRQPCATVLALPPPSGSGANAAAAMADPFAASLAVPPPTYVQMVDLQVRQRLLVEVQMAWQQYGRQSRPAWSYDHRL